jgi:hypothetical protein
MKVSIDGILGSAQKINSQLQLDEDNLAKKKKEVRSDSVNIGSRVNSRLDTIESELRDIQTSLTKNQIIRNGIDQLVSDGESGGSRREQILSDVRFNGNDVLREFIADYTDLERLDEKSLQVNDNIAGDTSRLKRLQVEVDNIMASNLAGPDRADSLMKDISGVLSDLNAVNPASISQLNPDSVMKLIK